MHHHHQEYQEPTETICVPMTAVELSLFAHVAAESGMSVKHLIRQAAINQCQHILNLIASIEETQVSEQQANDQADDPGEPHWLH